MFYIDPNLTVLLSSTMLWPITLLLFTGAVCLLFYFVKRKKVPLPPGPMGVPIFGILPFIDKPPHTKFQEYYEKYGKICSFYMGRKLVVLLSDYDVIKEAFIKQGDNFSGRPKSFPYRVFPDDEGIVTSDGDLFKQYKLFILSTLKDFGTLRNHFEVIVKENAEHFVKYLQTKANQSINILEPLGLSIAQTYCHIILGKKFDYDDPTFKKLIELTYRSHRAFNNGARIYLPWTRKIPLIRELVGENEMRDVKNGLGNIYGNIVEQNVENYVEGSKDSFIHTWFTEDCKRKIADPTDNVFSKKKLVHNIDILIAAGYETTTTTLRWAFLFLLENRHVQMKLIQELDEVLGNEKTATLDDMKNLPYMCAVIYEIHRYATIAPLAATHRNMYETVLDGFRIPRSSTIVPNVLAVHSNPNLFEDPLEFKPERFIDDQGKFRKSSHVIAFSLGKRQCPAEQMAQTEIFLYLTSIFQHFTIEKDDKSEHLSTARSNSLSSAPVEYTMRFIKRN